MCLIIIFCGDSALMLHSPPSHVNKSVWVSVCCSTPLGLCVCVNACVCARECVCVCADDTRIEDQRQKKWMKHDRPLGSCYYKCLTRCVMRPVYLCIRREHHQVNINFVLQLSEALTFHTVTQMTNVVVFISTITKTRFVCWKILTNFQL